MLVSFEFFTIFDNYGNVRRCVVPVLWFEGGLRRCTHDRIKLDSKVFEECCRIQVVALFGDQEVLVSLVLIVAEVEVKRLTRKLCKPFEG